MKARQLTLGRPLLYPWDRWFRARQFRLEKGRSYDCQTHSMAQQVRNAAALREIRVSLRIRDDIITVTRCPRKGAA